jgi:hypothetical protein
VSPTWVYCVIETPTCADQPTFDVEMLPKMPSDLNGEEVLRK